MLLSFAVTLCNSVGKRQEYFFFYFFLKEFGLLQLQIFRRQKTDSPGESQLQLDFISSQPVGYVPQTVDVLHMVFSPSVEVSPPSSCIRPDLGILLSICFLLREWDVSSLVLDQCI